jgi:tRNA threonylcarbamoyladenosine biosynthesis protein TsaB
VKGNLAIESADDAPGVALADSGDVLRVATWHTGRNHSVELMPAVDRLLREASLSKDDVAAVLVDIGPGGYAALRVGVSIAKALAHGLGVPLAGVGRLELDAYGVREATDGLRIVAVHRAGRGELAWATYTDDGGWREVQPPRLGTHDELREALHRGDVLTGEIDDGLRAMAAETGATVVAAEGHRVLALAALGHQRLAKGRADDPTTLVPLYLRGPAIGPQGR